jgi:hypothetical protein
MRNIMDGASTQTCCPVCGYDLGFKPWDGDSASFEICPSCGIQFGYTDAAGGDTIRRQLLYQQWRKRWIGQGMPWNSASERPAGWNAATQLRNIEGDPEP